MVLLFNAAWPRYNAGDVTEKLVSGDSALLEIGDGEPTLTPSSALAQYKC